MGRYVQVEPNVSIFVEDIGQGTPVVFLHGWPVNYKMFEYQLNVLPNQGIRAIAIDFRGYGKSDAPSTGYDYDRMADDVRAVIDDLELTDVVLAGFSMGGAIAVHYMARHAGHGVSSWHYCLRRHQCSRSVRVIHMDLLRRSSPSRLLSQSSQIVRSCWRRLAACFSRSSTASRLWIGSMHSVWKPRLTLRSPVQLHCEMRICEVT